MRNGGGAGEGGGLGREDDLDSAVVVALGANLSPAGGDCVGALERAFAEMARAGVVPAARSRIWRSAAWPDPLDPPFFNAVALVETALEPKALLDALHRIERTFGRVRGRANAPRPLDLDLVAYGRRVDARGPPVLPHPRAAVRRFVMGPLADIAPDWRHPVLRASAAALAETASVGRDARPI